MSMTPDPGLTGPWRPTVAHVRTVAVAIVLVAIAVVAGRPDLLVIATPFAVVAAWSTVVKPREPPIVVDRFGNPTLREGDATTWHADVTGLDPATAEFVTASVTPVRWVEMLPEAGTVTAPVESGRPSHVAVAIRSMRWGRRPIDPIRVTAVSRWAAYECAASTVHRSIHTLPVPGSFYSRAPLRPSDGLVGLYRASRAGEGSEFASIRPFAVGDRIRRINWPRSLRHDELVVNATWADQDTCIAFIVDAVADYGTSGGIDGAASSLDVTVRAAGAIAEHAIGRGDRVSLRTLGAASYQSLPPATGAKQLRRILDGLSRLRSVHGTISAGSARRARPIMHAGAELTVMLSPLIAREALDQAVALGRQGLPVVVIDTLPDDLIADADPYAALAWRIRLLERRQEIRRVQQVGIPVVRWRGPGSLDQFLRDASRRAVAPRMRIR